jgi:multidrug efflux pump subunit AcrA (membrane-fusion protein)
LPVRIEVTVSATDHEVLAVPVAALSVGPDGTSRVEVEREAAGDAHQGLTELVEVTVGLAAQGYAEVMPIPGATLEPGDRVVVGIDTPQRDEASE